MELPEISRALNDWQQMRNYNAELLSEQTRLIKERDQLREQNKELVEAITWAMNRINTSELGHGWSAASIMYDKVYAMLMKIQKP